MEVWKHYDSTHRHTRVHLQTRTHTASVQGPTLALSGGNPLCAFICKNLQRGLHSRPVHRASEGRRLVRTGCVAHATRVQSALDTLPAQRPAHPGQELALSRTQPSVERSHSHLSLRSRSRAQGVWRRQISTLGHSQRSLFTMVHVPEPVKLCKVDVGLHTPIFIWLERVGGSGAEETAV